MAYAPDDDQQGRAPTDTERLDWIDRNGVGVRRRDNGHRNVLCWGDIGSLRYAIDWQIAHEKECRS